MTEVTPTILVVEDDDETLNVISRALAAQGYDVVWARNGAETLKLLTRHEGPIALMILDVVLPGMSAPDLASKVQRRHPDAGVIYVSAYDTETIRAHGVDPDVMSFVPKTDMPDALLHTVNELCDR